MSVRWSAAVRLRLVKSVCPDARGTTIPWGPIPWGCKHFQLSPAPIRISFADPNHARVFISHSNVDRAAAFGLVEKLKEKGYQPFLDFESIAGGTEWQGRINDALRQSAVVLFYATPEACESKWVFAEVAIARFHGVPVIPLLMRDCKIWSHLEAVQQIDFRNDPGAAYARLWESLAGFSLERQERGWRADRPPYPGLAALQFDDAAVFFGRQQELTKAIEALRPGGQQHRLLAVIGPSGSGKSSFVKAGLIPELTTRADSNRWLYVPPFTPGETPFQNFAEVLCACDKSFTSVGEIEQRLRKEGGLLDVIRTARAHSGNLDAQMVVVIDQLEEIERRTPKAEANAFLESLAGALRAPKTPLIVIATLRSDFLSECLQFPSLSPLLASDSLLLGAMDRAALEEAVRGPARIAGVEFEPGLVERIVEDTEGGDALPLMADALHQLWKADPRRITHAGYRAMGGVQHGLSRRAQELYDSLSEETRTALRAVFVGLADVNERGDFTRRRLAADFIPDAAKPGVDAFVDARLLIKDGESVAVSHEALLRNWSLLRGWLEGESDRLRLRRQIEMDAREWDQRDRAEEYLWHWKRLVPALELMEEESWPEDDLRRQFLAVGSAREQTARARESEQLANRVLSDYERDPELGILLAIAAVETYGWTPRAELALNTAVDGSALRATLGHAASVRSAVFSRDGSRVVTASNDQTARLWETATGQLLQTLHGHSSSVVSAAFSSGGSRIVTTSDDQTARLWDAVSGQLLYTLSGHERAVIGAAFSPDALRIITCSHDGTARLWDAMSGQLLKTLRGHESSVMSAAFSPDASLVITTSHDGTARLWDTVSGQPVNTLKGHENAVASAAFSRRGALIVTASHDRTARLWNSVGGLLQVFRGHDDSVLSATFSPDESFVVTASRDHDARIWGVVSGALLHVLRGHEDSVRSATFSADGSRIVTASEDGTARLWDASSGQPLYALRGHRKAVVGAAFNHDGSRIVTASRDRTARLWDTAYAQPFQTIRGHTSSVTDAAFSPEGSRIVTASSDRTARLWDAVSGELLSILTGHDAAVLSAAFSRDGTRIITASDDRTARLWDASGQSLEPLYRHEDSVTDAAFSPDGARVLTACRDNTATVWDATAGEPLLILRGHEDSVFSAEFSPDGSRIVTASRDNTARLWGAGSGELLHTLRGHDTSVVSAAFSRDGTRIVTASYDNSARLWDAASGRLLRVLRGHRRSVVDAVFSPDGTRVVTASQDSTATVWDAASGQYLRTVRGHGDSVLSVAFDTDGSRIVTASDDATACIWIHRDRDALLSFAKQRAFRELTRDERRAYGLPV